MVTKRAFLLRIAGNRLVVVLIAGILGLVLAYNTARSAQDNQYEMRALAIAEATAAIPELPEMLTSGDPAGRIPEIAETIRKNTKATYVVIANDKGIRFSHPNPLMIGQRIDGQLLALQGKSYTTINNGSLGRSVNGKTPIYNNTGKIVGLVSAGILVSQLTTEGSYLLHGFLIYGLGFLFAGLILSEFFVRLSRNRRLAEELEEVTTQFQERDAMLHAIREGVITLNADKKITLINDEAIRLLDLSNAVIGKRIADVIPEGRLRALLEGDIAEGDDLRVLTDKFSILINRRVVTEKNVVLGSVITLRDRTEHIGLLRELESVQNFTEALRSQQHEFANRLHTINGLLELKKYDEASEFLGEIALVQTSLAEDLGIKLGNSLITALLIAKVAIARERGVSLAVEVTAPIDNIAIDQNALVTVVGNLIDNAIDAAAGSPKAEVTVVFSNTGEGGKFIRVHDSGPGLPETDPSIVFEDGYSTKSTRGAGHRGLGLAIVQRLVRQAAGFITAQNENGATFIVELPSIPANVLRGSKQ